MVDRPSPRVPTPYLVGPSSEAWGGKVDTVLVPTFGLPLERALYYAGQALGREATPLLLVPVSRRFVDTQAFDAMRAIGGFVIPVDDGWDHDDQLLDQVKAAIENGVRPYGEPPESADDAALSPSGNCRELTPEERLQFLKAFYGAARSSDGR